MIDKLIEPVSNILGKFIQDKDQRAALAHEIATMSERHAQEIALAQISVNKAEASAGTFRGGWRPAVGWVCALGFGVNFLISPIAAGFGFIVPQADVSTMMPVLMGLLGLGGMRSFEKAKGIK
jgi:hypothetical protein